MAQALPDHLARPLGVEDAAAPAGALRLAPRHLVAGLVLACGMGLVVYLAFADDFLGGEPHAIAPIVRREAIADPVFSAKPAPPAARASSTASELESDAGVAVVRPGGEAPSSVVIHVPERAETRLDPAPDRRLVERSRHGPLPRIGADGARPAVVYARPPGSLASGVKPAGRVAILVGGLGVSQAMTSAAIGKLPGAVTLAFAPYGADVETAVADARAQGHEVLLQVPMQPFDYPDSDPGPHTLKVEAQPAENLDHLRWLMARFTGYVGLSNFMGAKLTASEAALGPILREIGARGLFFFDDGSSPRSLAVATAAGVKTPAGQANMVIDGVARAEAIDKELARLEALARERGLALGSASALPLSVERIARWAKDLEAKGILLVPVSATLANAKR